MFKVIMLLSLLIFVNNIKAQERILVQKGYLFDLNGYYYFQQCSKTSPSLSFNTLNKASYRLFSNPQDGIDFTTLDAFRLERNKTFVCIKFSNGDTTEYCDNVYSYYCEIKIKIYSQKNSLNNCPCLQTILINNKKYEIGCIHFDNAIIGIKVDTE